VQEACPRNKRFRILLVGNPRGLVHEMQSTILFMAITAAEPLQ
jgi:hypothetical protein